MKYTYKKKNFDPTHPEYTHKRKKKELNLQPKIEIEFAVCLQTQSFEPVDFYLILLFFSSLIRSPPLTFYRSVATWFEHAEHNFALALV